jgi:hypothetical protein
VRLILVLCRNLPAQHNVNRLECFGHMKKLKNQIFSLWSLLAVCASFVTLFAHGQQVNPNNLPLCPKPDYSKKTDVERFAKWTNCWGKYQMTLDKNAKGDVLEGEWLNGSLHGQGAFYILSDKPWKGDKYVGEFKYGKCHGMGKYTSANGSIYVGEYLNDKPSGKGTETLANGDKYVGDFKDGRRHGRGSLDHAGGDLYFGEFHEGRKHGQGMYFYFAESHLRGGVFVGDFRDDQPNGQGVYTAVDGKQLEGFWENNVFIREAKINLPNQKNKAPNVFERENIPGEGRHLLAERQRLIEERPRQGQLSKSAKCPQIESGDDTWVIIAKLQGCEEKNHIEKIQKISLQVTFTEPSADGEFTIKIKTSVDTASLKINGEEQGGSVDGNYTIRKFARAGSTTEFNIVARDVNGNKDSKTITVQRSLSEGSVKIVSLNPTQVKKQPERDAVAIIIGIAEYKNLPKAEYANEDARIFYDYAMRALGITPENIKLLVDADADQADIYQAFKTWLPSRVRSTTDVYVYYSGHGLPAANGQEFYLLPQRAHRDLVEETAISQSKINVAIQATKPRSVTVFLDSCYSGMARTGETLLASARPLALKADKKLFPAEFTVIAASQADQISSSSPDLKHGIFSYYLMKGMEGDADADSDGKITLGEMQRYLVDNVGRQAGMMNRKQEPQLIGDANRVLVGR